MFAKPEPKQAVKMLREAFEQRNSDIKTKDAYELLARLWGFKDWPTAAASLKDSAAAPSAAAVTREKPFHVTPDAVANWPRLVFTNKGGAIDEPLYFYSEGVRLAELMAGNRRSWSIVKDDGKPSIEVPHIDLLLMCNGLRLQDAFVVCEVACEVASVEEYGLPFVGNEREVHEFAKGELGWSYLAAAEGKPLVPVTLRDRGDDGAEDYWVEAAVHPVVHRFLCDEFSPTRLAFERAFQEQPVSELVNVKDPLWETAFQPMRQLLVELFEELPEQTLSELVFELTQMRHPKYPYTRDHRNEGQDGLLREKFKSATNGELAQQLSGALDAVRAALRADSQQ